jgi:cytochrome bd-type quinol oxidase subunit 1
VPPERRREIAAALRAGTAVADPALAPTAAEAAEWRLHQVGRTQWLVGTAYAAVALVWLVSAVTSGDRSDAVLAGLFAVLTAMNVVVSRRTRRGLERALEANRDLAARSR